MKFNMIFVYKVLMIFYYEKDVRWYIVIKYLWKVFLNRKIYIKWVIIFDISIEGMLLIRVYNIFLNN